MRRGKENLDSLFLHIFFLGLFFVLLANSSMDGDGSFKQQGSIPFKWEIRPGVPKVQAQKPEQRKEQAKEKGHHHHHHHKAFPETPSKLAPPPAGIHFQPQMEPWTRSFLLAPKALSDRYTPYPSSTLAQPASVYPGGCLPSPPLLPKNKKDKKKINKHKLKVQPESEPDCLSDLATLSPGSISSRKSKSPFRASPLSSSFSSHRSSPRPAANDTAWASFGLF